MKIDNSVKSVGGLPKSEPGARSVKGQPASNAPQGGASVELSSLSSQLQKVDAVLANVPVVDSARVDEIKQAIASGRFRVDADKVADNLIESVRQMLGAQVGRA